MKYIYVGYEVRYPAKSPKENGKYFGKTPVFEQALTAAKRIGGPLYGIKKDGEKIMILY